MAGGLADIRRFGAVLGDFSAAKSPQKVPARFTRKFLIGRPGGKIFGKIKSQFGVVGLVATAEFFAIYRDVVRLNFAKPVYLGSMANYSAFINRGYTAKGGTQVAPRPFWDQAVSQAEAQRKAGKKGGSGKGLTKLRSGLYEGQKYIGDLGAFARGDLQRVARRAAGREVSGAMWGTWTVTDQGIKNPPNILVNFANLVLANARRNAKKMGIDDTGMLIASLQAGFTEDEFISKSIQGASRKVGNASELERRTGDRRAILSGLAES